MKKTYLTPATDVVEIQSTALLAASTKFEMDPTAGNANNALSYDEEFEEVEW